jgi:hypothetical protein
MPRYNVQNPETKEWRCFSSVIDDYITEWMSEKKYENWRKIQYGRNCGPLSETNIMTLEEAEKTRIRMHMKPIEEIIEIMTAVYDEGVELSRSDAELCVMYLELLRDMMHDTEHYRHTYDEWNE